MRSVAIPVAIFKHETMPRDGAIIFGDLVGKLDVLHVHAAQGFFRALRSGHWGLP